LKTTTTRLYINIYINVLKTFPNVKQKLDFFGLYASIMFVDPAV